MIYLTMFILSSSLLYFSLNFKNPTALAISKHKPLFEFPFKMFCSSCILITD